MVRRRRRTVRDPGVPAGDLRYDVLGRGCSWHHDRRPIGTVPLAGKVTGACDTDRPHLRYEGLRARRASPADHQSRLLRPLLALRGIPPEISGVLRTRWRRVRSGIGRGLRRSPACPKLGGIIRFGPTRRILLLAVDRRRKQPIRIRGVPPSSNRRLNQECLNLGVSEWIVSQDVVPA